MQSIGLHLLLSDGCAELAHLRMDSALLFSLAISYAVRLLP